MAELVLEAQYEHTILEGIKNNIRLVKAGKDPKPIILTQLGLGVFGNKKEWVETAMGNAIKNCGNHGLPFEVQINIINKKSNDVNFTVIETANKEANQKACEILEKKIQESKASESDKTSENLDGAEIGGIIGAIAGGVLTFGGLACVSALGTGIVVTAPVSIGIVATGIVVGAVAGAVLGQRISSNRVQNIR